MFNSIVGKDPLTWSYLKLFAITLNTNLSTIHDIPSSHALMWTTRLSTDDEIQHKRLITKVQCMGLVISINYRSERVEFIIDDGTGEIPAVLWTSEWKNEIKLGDLVNIYGKLKWIQRSDTYTTTYEIRLLRILPVSNPDEESLFWLQAMKVMQTFYTKVTPSVITIQNGAKIPTKAFINQSLHASQTITSTEAVDQSDIWNKLVFQVFFELKLDSIAVKTYIDAGTSKSREYDALVIKILEDLTRQQQQQIQNSILGPIKVTFGSLLAIVLPESSVVVSSQERAHKLSCLRKLFVALRQSGLLFMENIETDEHILLSFAVVFQHSLLKCFQKLIVHNINDSGVTFADLSERMSKQKMFRYIPLEWLEESLQRLITNKKIVMTNEDLHIYQLVQTTNKV